jgi:hypothetical protein
VGIRERMDMEFQSWKIKKVLKITCTATHLPHWSVHLENMGHTVNILITI